MNIYETKSRYFHNNNVWFATKFSSASITIVIILVAIVLLYISIRAWINHTYEVNFLRATETYLVDRGFNFSDLEFKWVMSEDADNNYCVKRYLFKASSLSHENLNGGKALDHNNTAWSFDLYIFGGSYGGSKLKPEGLSIVWNYYALAPGNTNYYISRDSISDWYGYLYNNKSYLFRKQRLCSPHYIDDRILTKLLKEYKMENKTVDSTYTKSYEISKLVPEPVPEPVPDPVPEPVPESVPTSPAIDDFIKGLDNPKIENNLNEGPREYIAPSAVKSKKKWDI